MLNSYVCAPLPALAFRQGSKANEIWSCKTLYNTEDFKHWHMFRNSNISED